MDVFLSAPPALQENQEEFVDFDEMISEVDIVMLLRVQFERHRENSTSPRRNTISSMG